jgi:hypothetical protein
MTTGELAWSFVRCKVHARAVGYPGVGPTPAYHHRFSTLLHSPASDRISEIYPPGPLFQVCFILPSFERFLRGRTKTPLRGKWPVHGIFACRNGVFEPMGTHVLFQRHHADSA